MDPILQKEIQCVTYNQEVKTAQESFDIMEEN